jgi:hypothetical protein
LEARFSVNSGRNPFIVFDHFTDSFGVATFVGVEERASAKPMEEDKVGQEKDYYQVKGEVSSAGRGFDMSLYI